MEQDFNLPQFDLQFFAGEKTEDATDKRLEDSRNRGQVPKSNEINSVLVLTLIFSYFYFYGDGFLSKIFIDLRFYLSEGLKLPLLEVYQQILTGTFSSLLDILYPILLIALLGGVLSNLAQIGFLFTTDPLIPDFSKLNPINGFQNMFGWKSVNELIKSVAKILAIGIIPIWVAYRERAHILLSNRNSVDQFSGYITGIISEIFIKVLILLIILALLDYTFQRWRYFENLKMSKDEVKDEHKSREGDPKIKQKIRERGRQLAQNRMFQDLPKADVVITNPTHLALAIHYDKSSHQAPKIIAKGSGFIAQKIKEKAKEYGIPVIENKPLAQELFKAVEIGDEIPEELYSAVAQILAVVFKDRKTA